MLQHDCTVIVLFVSSQYVLDWLTQSSVNWLRLEQCITATLEFSNSLWKFIVLSSIFHLHVLISSTFWESFLDIGKCLKKVSSNYLSNFLSLLLFHIFLCFRMSAKQYIFNELSHHVCWKTMESCTNQSYIIPYCELYRELYYLELVLN